MREQLATIIGLLERVAAAVEQRPAVEPECLTFAEAAQFIGVSISKLHALNLAGQVPAPLLIGDGNCPRFARTELRQWALAGCPVRARWLAMRESTLRRAG